MFELLPFGAGAWTVIFLYIGSLLLFGWYGYRSRTENTLNDFYLAGPGFGFFVLLLTLYATQYSGNVFFAFTGMTYRIGFSWIMSTYFMLAIVVFYLVYALRLRNIIQTPRIYYTGGLSLISIPVKHTKSSGRTRHDRIPQQFSPGAINGHGTGIAGDDRRKS